MRLFASAALFAAVAVAAGLQTRLAEYVEPGLQPRLIAQARSERQRDFSAAALTAPPTSRWPTNGGNLANQRYSPLTAINRGNVAQLKGVWRARLRGSGTQPQYSGFARAARRRRRRLREHRRQRRVRAVDRHRRDPLAVRPPTSIRTSPPSAAAGTTRASALSEDKVFEGLLDGRLVALDRATGKIAWSIQAERWQENFSITAAPLYVETSARRSAEREGGMVIVGFAGGDRGTRGRLKAYDAKDGRLIWTFYTIPGPGEPGHETWPKGNDAGSTAAPRSGRRRPSIPSSACCISPPATPRPTTTARNRAGDNLYAASMLAIEAATGKYRWHFQQVHHDIWDYDAVNPVVLMDVRMGGRTRKAIVEVGKTGWAYILDRETGKPLIGIDEKPVPQEPRQATAKTQPFPRGDSIVPQFIEMAPEGHTLVNDGRIFTPFVGKDPTIVAPGIWGGASWPPSSYDPVQQRLYVCASSVINGYTSNGATTFVEPVNGNSFLGGATTFTRVARTGIIAALDVTTNTLAWRYQWPEQCYSGTTATAGGLLFVGRNDGRVLALDSAHRETAVGLPDRRRHARARQHVRAQGQAVRARVLGRCRAARFGARR